MLEKNQIIEVEITDYDYEGLGIAHYDNHTIFVKEALKGEVLLAHILRVTSNVAFAKIERVLKYSEARTIPECDYYRLCGGCSLMHMDYEEQLSFKLNALKRTISKLNGEQKINDILVSKQYGYRNKVALPIRNINGKLEVGFYQERSHNLIPSNYCLLESFDSRIVVNEFIDLFNEKHLSAFDEITNSGLLKHIVVRENSNKEFMVTIVAKENNKELFEILKNAYVDKVKSLYLNIHPDNTNVITGRQFILVSGEPYLYETILGNKYKLHPNSFMQVNHYGMEILYNKAISYLNANKEDVILDAYCGIGTISLSIANNVKKVIGVEIVEEAIMNAKENALINKINNAEFICGKAEEEILKIVEKEKLDGVIVDPPRKGVDKQFLDSLIKANVKKIVYVSCNPATLSRDIKYLADNGYLIKEITPVEMFANTQHIESITTLALKK